jgi:phenylalanyl-tRNA synthetase beta chain
MRAPLSWLRAHTDLPAGTRGVDVAAALVRVGLEDEGLHGADVTGPLVVGEVVSAEPEPQKNGKTIHWCQVRVGALGAVLPGDRLAQDLRPRLRRHDLLGEGARPR